MEERVYYYKNVPFHSLKQLKDVLASHWEDGKDEMFGLDKGNEIKAFHPEFYEAFQRANEKIEQGEDADVVFFRLIYDGKEQPDALYWKDASVMWKPYVSGDREAAGVGYFILSMLWLLHPEYEFPDKIEDPLVHPNEKEKYQRFLELLNYHCFSAYLSGYDGYVSEKAKNEIEIAENLFEGLRSGKGKEKEKNDFIRSLYQGGYELFGHNFLQMDDKMYENMEELRQEARQAMTEGMESYFAFCGKFYHAQQMDMRFYQWMIYTHQEEKFDFIYGIRQEEATETV